MALERYVLHSLVGGSNSISYGADFATFKVVSTTPGPHVSTGEFKLMTQDWIKRGRPTTIVIDLPEAVEES